MGTQTSPIIDRTITSGISVGYVTTSTTSQVVIRATTYTRQSSNAQRSLKSSSANDTAAGTGARTISLIYFDVNGNGPFFETVTLNGTTAVNTVNTNICFIEDILVLTVGSGGVNAGTISLYSTTAGGGTVIGSIAAGDNGTFWAHHYVPLGKIHNLSGMFASHNGTTAASGGVFVIRSLPLNITNAVESFTGDYLRLYGQSGSISRTFNIPFRITGPAQVTMYVVPESSSSVTYRGSFEYYE